MEEIVAVAVKLDNGQESYFLTWGRIHHAVDPRPVTYYVLQYALKHGAGGKPVGARLCGSLHEAAGGAHFFESFFTMAQQPIPRSQGEYGVWRRAMMTKLENGDEVFPVGRQRRVVEGGAADVTIGDGYEPPLFAHEPLMPFTTRPQSDLTLWCEDELGCHIWLWEIGSWEPSPTRSRPRMLCDPQCTIEQVDAFTFCTVCGRTLGPAMVHTEEQSSEVVLAGGDAGTGAASGGEGDQAAPQGSAGPPGNDPFRPTM